MQIHEFEVSKLIPYQKNAKKHPKEQIEHTANSIKRFGMKQPLVIDKNNVVIVGHCRLLAAKKLGMKTVPCILADDLTEEEVKAYRLADNKTNESEWDVELLDLELEELTLDDIDMSDFGFELSDGGRIRLKCQKMTTRQNSQKSQRQNSAIYTNLGTIGLSAETAQTQRLLIGLWMG